MSDLTDALEHAAWMRRAHRWTLGLAVQLAVNCAMVALALGGFGASRPEFPAAIPSVPPSAEPATVPAPPALRPAPTEDPTPTQPLTPAGEPAVPQPSRAPLVIERPAPPATVEPPAAKEPTPDPPEPPPPPATPPLPPENATPELEAGWLTIVNPPDTGGPVHLTVEGVVYRLAPGEYCQVAAGGARRVAYHQGDDFGYARHDLARGTHAFEIGNTGWTLKPLTPAAARQLVEHCRLRTAERE